VERSPGNNASGGWLLPAVFSATILLSASLLFSIQPLVGKELLPLLGGAPAVWNTVMVFFQAILLAGYSYAHVSVRVFGLRAQPWVHLVLVVIGGLCLPFALRASGDSALQIAHPAVWALFSLTRAIGMPVFILAATAPLLQKWFASTRHPAAGDPYFLYAASNIGSFGALFAYPFLIEPLLRLKTQTNFWAAGFWAFAICITVCVLARRTNLATPQPELPASSVGTIELKTILKWIALSFVPSSLMLGVTTYITTDVASIPLLWVAPLALYLLTFVIAFGKPGPKLEMLSGRAIPILALAVVFPILVQATEPVLMLVLLHLIFFFVAALRCHLKLAASRPPASQLTAFYLYLSLGGVLGGIFNALLAPVLFTSVVEYPLTIIFAIFIGYPLLDQVRKSGRTVRSAAVIIAMAIGAALVAKIAPRSIGISNLVAGVCLLSAFLFLRAAVPYTLAIATLLACTAGFRQTQNHVIARDRNFFGVLRVSNDADKPLRRLFHGTTVHGVQFRIPARQCEPLSYYHSEGPVGEIAKLFESTRLPRNVALVGLGAGAMITYGKPDQRWTLYEIDPAVVRIARDTNLFTYLGGCASARFEFEIGDARLRLAQAPDNGYGLIFLDAFSSDVIPMHLLTIQALQLYRQKLAPDGILAFHLSSRHFELEPLVARLGEELHLKCFASTRGDLSPKAIAEGGLESNWVILVPDAVVPSVLSRASWERVAAGAKAPFWTDDFSSLLGVLKLD
jgi:hypothetical protein